jgi:hypothetical protein
MPVASAVGHIDGPREWYGSFSNWRWAVVPLPLAALGLEFRLVGDIEPARNSGGHIIEFRPQADYRDAAATPLHRYGTGPFCKFRVSTACGEGVYAFVVAGEVMYVGECEDLASRMNAGYGNISPRNCYRRGQHTNCRVNALVLEEAARGHRIMLWFHATRNRKAVEADVLRAVQPPWNRAGVERPWVARTSTSMSAPVARPAAQPQPRADPLRAPITHPAPVEAVLRRDRSTVERPVRLMWAIADEMTAANPSVTRREVIAECVRRGVALNTAKTQYSAWRLVRGVR